MHPFDLLSFLHLSVSINTPDSLSALLFRSRINITGGSYASFTLYSLDLN